jgi:hypothetical protein
LFGSYGCCSGSNARLLPAMRPAWLSHSNCALVLGSGSESWLLSGGVHGLPPCTLSCRCWFQGRPPNCPRALQANHLLLENQQLGSVW